MTVEGMEGESMSSFEEFCRKLKGAYDFFQRTKDRDIVIFGAGNTAVLYKECIESEDVDIACFCDNNASKQNTCFMGKKVVAPDSINEMTHNPVVLVLSMNPDVCDKLKKQCRNMNLECSMFDEYLFGKHCRDIYDVYENLNDARSKDVYSTIIECRMEGIPVDENIYSERQYFGIPQFRRNRPGEVFVDCGAFVGDSIEKYIWEKTAVFSEIYGFEPNAQNYNALIERIGRLNREWGLSEDRITAVNAGVGDITGCVSVENTAAVASTTSRIGRYGEGNVKIYALDEFFGDAKVDFIKADIEGFEKNMLYRAKKVIQKNHPLIAVCIYHSAIDMYKIMRIIKKYDDNYKFAVRHHSYDYCETVLYAWWEERDA